MDLLESFGKGLRRLQKMEGLTLAKLSQRSGISQVHIINLENGLINPKLLTINGLAQAFGRDIPELCRDIFTLQSEPEILEEFFTKVRSRAVDGLVEINIPRYARELGLSPSTIKRYVKKLKHYGYLRPYHHKTGRGNGAIFEVTKKREIKGRGGKRRPKTK